MAAGFGSIATQLPNGIQSLVSNESLRCTVSVGLESNGRLKVVWPSLLEVALGLDS